jgi:hypothetical protein
VGNVVIEALQPGNATYLAAPPVQRSFTVGKAGQSLTFNQPPNRTFGEPPFALSATASSGLPVSFRLVSGPATLSGSTVTLTGTGTVTVEALQPGNDCFSAAWPLQRSFTVTAASNTTAASTAQQPVPLRTEALSTTVQLYPNPVRTQATLCITTGKTATGTLTIYDVTGRRLRHQVQAFSKGQPLSLPLPAQGLPAGHYTLLLQLPGEAPLRCPFALTP